MDRTDFMLPVQIEKDFTTNLFHTLPLCVIKNNPLYTDWVCENFVNIHIQKQRQLDYTNQFQKFLGLCYDIFQQEVIYNHLTIKNISGYIENKLMRSGSYCYIVMDEFYLSAKPSYQVRHFFHDSLIYGCNPEKREFFALTLGEKEILEKAVFPYDELAAAYYPFVKAYSSESIVFFKINPEKDLPPFSFEKFLNYLIHYTNGVGSQDRQLAETSNNSLSPFGVNVYRLFTEYLRGKGKADFMDFKQFHFLHEHKKSLLNGFRLLLEKGYADSGFNEYISLYSGIAERMAQLRMLAMKCMRRQSYEVLCQLCDKLLAFGKQEKKILLEATEYLKQLNHCKTVIPFDRFDNPFAKKMINITDYASVTKCVPGGPRRREYKYAETFEVAWADEVYIDFLSFIGKERTAVYRAGQLISQSNSLSNGVKMNPYSIDVKRFCRSLRFDLFSDYPIEFESLSLNVFSGSITHGKTIAATSCWKGGSEGFKPESAIDYTENYWNAQADFKKPESLEVDLGAIHKINRMVLQEREAHRIRHYKIEALAGEGAAVLLAERKGALTDSPVVHEFPVIQARILKLTILETETDPRGYSEPGIRRFEAYYCPERS